MDWFERITGFREGTYEETKSRLRIEDGRLINETNGVGHDVGRLELASLGELRALSAGIDLPGFLTLGILEGDVRKLHADPENAGATFQVASQFNLLEMVGPGVTPEDGVSRYAHDRTQGPACAISAGAGTIWRNYLVPVHGQTGQTAARQLNGLADLEAALAGDMGTELPLWEMRNGYALPERASLAAVEAHLAGLDDPGRDRLRALLRVGLHSDVGVTEPGAAPDARVTQVYASALPVAYSGIRSSEWAGLASLVLEAAYEATFHAALLNAAHGRSNRLLLTRLGGGAFGNEEGWISKAILRSLPLFRDHGLETLMVSYGLPARAMLEVERAWSGPS
jgi:hypothetical protein